MEKIAMENKVELTVEEKRDLAMEIWKNYLLSVQHGDEQSRAAEKDQLIRHVMAENMPHPVVLHHVVNHYG
jgi:hypothetical protein